MKAATLGRVMAGVAAAALIVIGVITVWPSSHAGPAVAASTPGLSASTAATEASSQDNPTPSPSRSSQERSSFEKRVLAFEEAYRLFDPQLRKERLKPYVTEEFLSSLFPETETESAYLKQLREGKSQSLNLETASVVIEPFDEDPNLLEVFTQITQIVKDGDSTRVMTVNHTSYWIQVQPGVWKARADTTN